MVDNEGMSTATKSLDEIDAEIAALQQAVESAKQEVVKARRLRPTESVENYALRRSTGELVTLSELFGTQDDLILIHNMGKGCVYCTLWADGFIGFYPHLANRAAFVVASPDPPVVQKAFADSRGWTFPMVSMEGTTMNQDLGFYTAEGEHPGNWPGVSTFRKLPDGTIVRVNKAIFGPGDDFCALWPLFDLLEGGAGQWEPEFSYPVKGSEVKA